MKQYTSLTALLTMYYKWQNQIVLVYRPTEETGWNNRVLFLDEKYNSLTPYNHRIMLRNEIVIEYDNDDKAKNLSMVREVIKRLKKDSINYSLWDSGNKSYHCHIFLNVGNAINLNLLKRCFVKHYCSEIGLPDMQMCGDNHLVRAEFGVNEKSGRFKTLVENSKDYPLLNYIPKPVWEVYNVELTKSFTKTIMRDTKEILDMPVLKTVLDTIRMKDDIKDGRQRVLWMLSHLLKSKYSKQELKSFLNDWYSYSGGSKLNQTKINQIVESAYTGKSYTIGPRYVKTLAEDLGLNPETGEVLKSDSKNR